MLDSELFYSTGSCAEIANGASVRTIAIWLSSILNGERITSRCTQLSELSMTSFFDFFLLQSSLDKRDLRANQLGQRYGADHVGRATLLKRSNSLDWSICMSRSPCDQRYGIICRLNRSQPNSFCRVQSWRCEGPQRNTTVRSFRANLHSAGLMFRMNPYVYIQETTRYIVLLKSLNKLCS